MLSKIIYYQSYIYSRESLVLHTLLSLFTASLVPPSAAVSVNITVDDTFGSKDGTISPVYIPANSTWHAGSPTEQCAVCAIKPSELDTTEIVEQSWHHGSYLPGIPIYVQVTFPGTAVYVYNVVPNTLPGANTFVNISFVLDGEFVGRFLRVPDATSEILYNHLVYANASLSADVPHTLEMSATGGNESLIFFDYLLYTTDTEPSTSTSASTSSHRPVQAGAIAGGVIAGVALLVTIAAILFFLLRRRPTRSHLRTGLPGTRSEVFRTDQATPQMTSASARARPLSAGGFSRAGTLAGPSLRDTAFTSSSAPSLSSGAFESKRVAELERTIERLRHEMRSMSPFSGHDHETGSEVSKTNGAPAGALQAMQAEIDALRSLLSAVVDTGSCEETLPLYEDSEARHGRRE
ncbi:hypothetical protein V8D89_003463 [Ganoderma adspersum]